MKIFDTVNAVKTLNFNGIKPRYINNQGYEIVPISKDPTQDEIDEAINATKKSCFSSGCNGRAYFLGEDLVVKKYKPLNESAFCDPQREINILDKMYNKGFVDGAFQEGKFAFSTPSGQTYLVSNKVEGSMPDVKSSPFNDKNLSKLVQILEKFDSPIKNKEITKTNVPFEIAMHYDLAKGNINIGPDCAALLDFEYMKFEDIEANYRDVETQSYYDTNCNSSDVPGVISNLRGFEYRTLIDYLTEIPKSEARKLFLNYLNFKTSYHDNLSDKYRMYGSKNEASDKISDSYKNKSIALKKAVLEPKYNQDVISAEARKIQIASFIYQQSQYQKNSNEKINPEQIKYYLHDTEDFFTQQYYKAIYSNDLVKKNYYLDCLKVLKGWMGVINWMDWQKQEPIKEKFENEEDYNIAKNNHELFIKKITHQETKTLDRIVQ